MPKTVLFFNHIELVFEDKANFSNENAQFEKFQNSSEQRNSYDLGAKYLVIVSSRSLKMREFSFAQFDN
jgi:hypothetical protein